MVSKRIAITLGVLSCVVFATAVPFEENSIVQAQGNETGTLRTLITVYAFPMNGATIYLKLFSRDDSVEDTFTSLGQVEYGFTAGIATKFWVDAIKVEGGSTKIIFSAPVFGDGVPTKSGTWWVDSNGLKRIKEDSTDCPDHCQEYRVGWRNL